MENKILQIILENNINLDNMFNKERKLQFITDCYSNFQEKSIMSIVRKFNQYGKIESKLQKDFFEFSSRDFIQFFSSFPWTYTSFMSNKSIIKTYLDWGRDLELIPDKQCRILENIDFNKPSHKKMYEKYYFKNFQELQKTIDFYRNKIKQERGRGLFDLVEIAVYLVWSGIPLDYVITLKPSDINFDNRLIFVKPMDRYFYINSVIANKLYQYITVKENNANDYVKTDYLLRKNKSGKIDKPYLSSLTSRYLGDSVLNEFSNNKVINYQKLYYSGIYYRAKIDEAESGVIGRKDIRRINNLFQEHFTEYNPQTAIAISKLLTGYRDYLKYMYREEFYKM